MCDLENHLRKRKARVPHGCSRSFNREKDVIQNLIGDFNAYGSEGAKLIEKAMGTPIRDISQNNLNSFAKIIGLYINKNFTRNHNRSKLLAIKWFDENCEIIKTILPTIKLEFGD